ncbi:MAG TPA: DUF1016 domain-containing protein, partial [Eubacteriaceae bacterium]|nr:DUF1016 domain-containing protein [Eubacteriaceae bacterium]
MDIIKQDPVYDEYISLLSQIKTQIKVSRVKATLSINAEMLYSYWFTGKTIIYMLEQKGWGKKIIQQLSDDLKTSFPNEHGFSVRNLQYMKKFAAEYPFAFTQQVVAQLPDLSYLTSAQQPVAQIENLPQKELLQMVSWSHHCILMDKVPDIPERYWYMQQTIKNGWSRNILALQIESNLFERQVNVVKIQNYKDTLPPVQSDFAIQLLKDPYIFDFITLKEKMNEQDIEEQLCSHISNFLLELGQGFSFVGRQYHLQVNNDDFYIDLLFYHIKLRCYVVIELKATNFKPDYVGQLNFYISAVDDILKSEKDNPSIGILLCKSKNEVVAEYALRGMAHPMGVADFKLS